MANEGVPKKRKEFSKQEKCITPLPQFNSDRDNCQVLYNSGQIRNSIRSEAGLHQFAPAVAILCADDR